MHACTAAWLRGPQCTLNWTFASKWVIIASMPILAIACTIIVAVLVTAKNYLLEKCVRAPLRITGWAFVGGRG